MDQSAHPEFDVIVAGGGPGGATAATLLAKRGHRVLLLEKERFPRYQIGESLLPSTVHGVCEMLGVSDELARAGFPVKRGGTFRWGANPDPWTFTFALSRKLAGRTSTAYQVDRARFDQILLENARKHGVDVREEHEVLALIEEDGRYRGVRFRDDSGAVATAAARYVVVAAGSSTALYKGVGERVYSDFFRNVAVFGYFEGGKRLPAPNEGNILCSAFDDGWMWYIPISDTLTSVGAVVASERAATIQKDREGALHGFVDSCPIVRDYLSEARRVTSGKYGEVRVRKDYSYRSTRYWRPGAVLVGDAACFVDPVFSTGVHLATYSGVLAARSISTVLSGSLPEAECFREFERRYARELEVYHTFLQAMYNINESESSYFWEARKVLGTDQPDEEAFVDLVAGVSAPGASRFGDALRDATRPESLDEGDAVFAGEGTRFLGSVLREAGDLQLRAVAGEQDGPEPGMFPDGLVSSADGLSWERRA
ncbi:NAD(P)/FAD-dependent oxidoreductase [Amycolatopsis ultiminotia]|uniref:NAD(P)/FAD-dependent oxidoreductase n=1 Tax=Amycolatopsis ultiminotia TaxID=543629 RepID=A0ABP6XQR9_9PSEU